MCVRKVCVLHAGTRCGTSVINTIYCFYAHIWYESSSSSFLLKQSHLHSITLPCTSCQRPGFSITVTRGAKPLDYLVSSIISRQRTKYESWVQFPVATEKENEKKLVSIDIEEPQCVARAVPRRSLSLPGKPSTVIPPCAGDCSISSFVFGGGTRCRSSGNMPS